jgi:hypothetical protein
MTSAISSQTFPIYTETRRRPSGALGVWARLLVPGCTQWSWGQSQRALVFGGTYFSSLATALLLWGDPACWLFLAVAIAARTTAWIDAQRQEPFSGFTPTSVLVGAGGCISLIVHGPLIVLLLLMAWPGVSTVEDEGSYLINRLAYYNDSPAAGDWVWLHGSATHAHHLARVVAVGGQEVEWTGRRWQVDGKNVDVESSRKVSGYPKRWKFRVPGNHSLLDPETDYKPGEPPTPLIVVENGQIAGRVWVRCAPFWERKLL